MESVLTVCCVSISMQESKHKRTDRSVLCYLRKAQPGKAWPRLTKDKTKVGLTHNWGERVIPLCP